MSGDLIRKGNASDVIFDRAILDEAVRLGKGREETDRLTAATTKEASDEDEQSTTAHPTQVAAVVAQGAKCFCAATMGTLRWWPHPFVETFGDISFWININGVDQLHDQLRQSLRILVLIFYLLVSCGKVSSLDSC
jgi:hypothetical protein